LRYSSASWTPLRMLHAVDPYRRLLSFKMQLFALDLGGVSATGEIDAR
jgi:hypothetical protein